MLISQVYGHCLTNQVSDGGAAAVRSTVWFGSLNSGPRSRDAPVAVEHSGHGGFHISAGLYHEALLLAEAIETRAKNLHPDRIDNISVVEDIARSDLDE